MNTGERILAILFGFFFAVIGIVWASTSLAENRNPYVAEQRIKKENDAIQQCAKARGMLRMKYDGEQLRLEGCSIPTVREDR